MPVFAAHRTMACPPDTDQEALFDVSACDVVHGGSSLSKFPFVRSDVSQPCPEPSGSKAENATLSKRTTTSREPVHNAFISMTWIPDSWTVPLPYTVLGPAVSPSVRLTYVSPSALRSVIKQETWLPDACTGSTVMSKDVKYAVFASTGSLICCCSLIESSTSAPVFAALVASDNLTSAVLLSTVKFEPLAACPDVQGVSVPSKPPFCRICRLLSAPSELLVRTAATIGYAGASVDNILEYR